MTEERRVRPMTEENIKSEIYDEYPLALDKPNVNQEIIDNKSKDEMKQRLQYQVKCGTFINPKYQKRISGCGTKAIMKLHKPNNKKLNDLRNTNIKNVPKAIKDVYNEAIPKFNISKDNTCQHVQKGVTMSSSSSRFQLIEDELPSSVDDIFSNDSSFDPYSNFQ